MSVTQTLPNAAVDALVALLPTGTPLKATVSSSAPVAQLGAAVVASFVGVNSADLAVIVPDVGLLRAAAGTDSALVSNGDVLRPALEAAARALGTGVLGDTRTEDATTLFADPDTVVFELTDNGQRAGWFGIRIRGNGAVSGTIHSMNDSVVGKLGRISNVEMSLTVEIGRTRMSVRDVLALEPGAVVELDRSAGAPADVLLNGRLIAHGEIVVVDQDYAVRITKILDVAEGLS
jgi:flagellar motor switch protein FliN/FliY